AYSYWQCFSLEHVKMECDSLGYDPVVKNKMGYMVVNAHNESGIQSYLARDAMKIRDCNRYLVKWTQKTKGETFVCISGSYGAFSGMRNGRKETDWVFDKFKTHKGCESYGVACRLLEVGNKTKCR